MTDGFCYSGQYLAVVQLDCHTDTELAEHHIYHLDKLYLIEQRVRAHNIGIALVKLAVTALLRAVGTPYGLYLETFERELQLLAMHHHEACEWYCEIVAETFFAELGRKFKTIA